MVELVNPLENAVVLLQDFGFFTVILPFVLVYALVFGLLGKVKIFGEADDSSAKTVNQIIALSVGAFVITSTDAVNNIASIIPQAGFFLVSTLLILMVLGLLGLKNETEALFKTGSTIKNLSVFGVVLLFLLVIDMGVESGIPFIRPLSIFLVGQSATFSGAGFESFLALILLLGFPLAVIYLLNKK
ncbi:MAG: hypothetical protein VW079_01995 [Candidatus Woesearchaeota archaeon]